MPRQPKITRAAVLERRLLTIAEAADYAGTSTMTIRRRIADGLLPGYRFGPRLLKVDQAELDAAMRQIPTAGGAA